MGWQSGLEIEKRVCDFKVTLGCLGLTIREYQHYPRQHHEKNTVKTFGCSVFFSGYNQKHCNSHEKSDLEIQQSVFGRKLSKIHFSVFQISIALTLHLAPILVFF